MASRLNLFLHNNVYLLTNDVPFLAFSLGLYTVSPEIMSPFEALQEVHYLNSARAYHIFASVIISPNFLPFIK